MEGVNLPVEMSGAVAGGNAGAQRGLGNARRGDEHVGIRRREILVEHRGERIPLVAHVVRIDGNAVAAADHRLGAETIGQADAWSEALLAGGGAGVRGSAALAADQNRVGGGVVPDRAVLIVREDRIVFPAHAVVDGQVAAHLPLIARVERPIGEAQSVGVLKLRDLSEAAGEAQQELRPGIGRDAIEIDCGAAF